MKEAKGNIWKWHNTHWILVPTNIGWKSNGENVMGRGIAKEAKEKFPDLPREYGDLCRVQDGHIHINWFQEYKLGMCPTKKLDKDYPQLSYKQNSDIDTIKETLYLLSISAQKGEFAIPLLGCGNGGLTKNLVYPIMKSNLDDRFTLIEIG